MANLTELFKRPLLFVSGVLSTITLLWGLVAIFKDLKEFYGVGPALYIISILLALLLIPALLIFLVSVWRWFFSIPVVFSDKYLYLNIEREWRIDDRGCANILQHKQYVFVDTPTKEDLVDIVFSSQPIKLEELNQQSEDSRYIDHHEISSGVHKVYWEPKRKGAITVGKSYKHSTKFDLPIDYVPTYKVMTIPFTVPTLKFSLTLFSERPFTNVVAFKGSRFVRLKNSGNRIADRARRLKKTRAPLPEVTNEKIAKWEVNSVKAGDTFFVVVYY